MLEFSRPLGSTFGIDPRASWMPVDVGYSPNDAKQPVRAFPVTELLGAVGLQTFRFRQEAPKRYRYFLWDQPLPAMAARAAIAGALVATDGMTYEFTMRERGKFKLFDHSTPVEVP